MEEIWREVGVIKWDTIRRCLECEIRRTTGNAKGPMAWKKVNTSYDAK